VITDYTLHGKNVVHMTQGSNELHFFYDAQNKPAVVIFNGIPYSYVKNLQGDIVAILDQSGNVVVQYTYDAWGRPISKTGSMKDSLGTLNPFRYRGYVYDEETELYYLCTRYYSATSCRFFSADDTRFLSTGKVVSCNALYVYCSNNPIIGFDPYGEFNWGGFLLGAALFVAGVAVVAAAVVTAGASIPATAALATATSSAVATTVLTTTAVTVGVAYASAGASIATAAATDGAAVTDVSISLGIPCISRGAIRYGCTSLWDFSQDDMAVYRYDHAGMEISGTSICFSSGMVQNYEGPDSYSGPFWDVSVGGKYGINQCWAPGKSPSKATGAVCFTVDLLSGYTKGPSLPMSVGSDTYSSPVRVW
ncbi:MAG: RHS repeat domain-containing protein, partial [Faecousia sp.]